MSYITADNFRKSKMRGFNLGPVLTSADLNHKNLPALRATGANIARYWIRVKHDANNVYTFTTPDQLTTLDQALALAAANNLLIMLTLEVQPTQAACDLWGSTARKAGVIKIWQQLATRYKNNQTIAGYDLINEPRIASPRTIANTTTEYRNWQIDCVKAIRAIDPNHVIAIECLGNSMFKGFVPLPFPNIIYSPHGYSPLKITHQGINAYLGSTATETSNPYPAPSGSYVADYFPNVSYWADPLNFGKANTAVIWIGEFSCINWARKNSKGEWTSTRWIQDCIKFMEEAGWSWCYHAWREFEAWDAEIPSSYYDKFTFKNAAPFTRSTKPSYSDWHSQASSSTPTMLLLKQKFALNV